MRLGNFAQRMPTPVFIGALVSWYWLLGQMPKEPMHGNPSAGPMNLLTSICVPLITLSVIGRFAIPVEGEAKKRRMGWAFLMLGLAILSFVFWPPYFA